MKPLFALLLACLWMQSALAGEAQPQPTPDDGAAEKIVLQLQAARTVDVVTEELRAQGIEEFRSISADGTIDEDALANHLKAVSKKCFSGDPETLARLESVVWKNIAHWIIHETLGAIKQVRTEARLFGVDVGITYLVGSVLGYAVPAVLAALAQPVAAGILLVIPTSTIETAVHLGLKDLLHHHKIVSEYGGTESYRYYMGLERSAREKLHLHSKNDLIIPLTQAADHDSNSVVLSNDSILRDILSIFAPHEDRLTFHVLKRVALKMGMTQEEIQILKNQVDGRAAQASILFQWIEAHATAEELAALKDKFSDSFIHMESNPQLTPISEWAGGTAEVVSCEELVPLAQNAPIGASVPLVLGVWDNVILPKVAVSFNGLHINPFYRMSKKSTALSIQGRLAIHDTWNSEWEARLMDAVNELCPQ